MGSGFVLVAHHDSQQGRVFTDVDPERFRGPSFDTLNKVIRGPGFGQKGCAARAE